MIKILIRWKHGAISQRAHLSTSIQFVKLRCCEVAYQSQSRPRWTKFLKKKLNPSRSSPRLQVRLLPLPRTMPNAKCRIWNKMEISDVDVPCMHAPLVSWYISCYHAPPHALASCIYSNVNCNLGAPDPCRDVYYLPTYLPKAGTWSHSVFVIH